MIRLYGFEECMPCQQVKRLLEKFGIEYEYIDVLKKNVDFEVVPVLELNDGTILKNSNAIAEYLRKEGKKHRVKFKAELYYHNKKIAEGPFEEKPFGSGIPGPEGMLGIRNTAFHVKWFKEDKVKK